MDELLKTQSQSELIGIIDSLQMLIGDQNIQLVELRHRRDNLLRSNNDYEQRYRDEKQKRIMAEAAMSNTYCLFHEAVAGEQTLVHNGEVYSVVKDLDNRKRIHELTNKEFMVHGITAKINTWKEAGRNATDAIGLIDQIESKIKEFEEAGPDAKAQQPNVPDATVSLSLSSYDELNSRLAVRDGLLDKIFMKITEWQNAGYKAHDGLTVLSDIQLQIYNFMNLSKAEEASFDVNRDNGKV